MQRSIQQASAKLVKISGKVIKRCHKIQFFSEYSVYFIVNMQYLFIRKCFKISFFRTILPCRFVCILKAPFSHLRRAGTEVGRKAEQALLYRGTECCRIRIERADDGGGRQRCGLAKGSLKSIFARRLPSSWHQMFPIPQAARKMEKNRIKITIKIPFCNIECVVPALQTRHLSLNKGLVPTAG